MRKQKFSTEIVCGRISMIYMLKENTKASRA